MIISASRRTDIPAYYAAWFFNRIREGFVSVRNPFYSHQVSKVFLSPERVDAFVFWTKNPKPMLNHLHLIKAYPYYFQFTLNAYAQDIETRLPEKSELVDTFISLAEKIGPHRVIWRYDPILLNDTYPIAYHIEQFGIIARKLQGYTKKVSFSFMDFYKKNAGKDINIAIKQEEKVLIATYIAKIAQEQGLLIETCAETMDLSPYGISHGRCIDDTLISQLSGYSVDGTKDKNQRLACRCVESLDIGVYNTCLNGCVYCYANHHPANGEKHAQPHNPLSPLMIGEYTHHDRVKERSLKSHKRLQNELF
ncbi:MAG: DUF1848 domain-containing protein [Treponema sp.]|jgi:hypothetical protein|nr:DUF1848 domain-containing protein [Treponema sp.]